MPTPKHTAMTESASPLPELPAVGFLADVPAEHRAFLTAFGKFRRPRNGEVYIAEDSPQDTLSLVLSGTLHVVSDASGRTMLLATVGEGDSLGEINLFDPATASATVIARSDCLIWSVTREEIDSLLAADAGAGVSLMKGLLRQLSKRVRMMNEKLAFAEQKASFHDLWSATKP
jgi:CRP-like cAMP-binding protein